MKGECFHLVERDSPGRSAGMGEDAGDEACVASGYVLSVMDSEGP